MGWESRELFPERDRVLREAVRIVSEGGEISDGLATAFFSFVVQIAARAAFRVGVRGDLVDEVTAATGLRMWGAMGGGKCKPRDAPMAAYVSTVARRTAINMSERQAVRDKRETPLRNERRQSWGKKWPPERPVEDKVALQLVLEQVDQAISRLPDPQRVIVELLPTHSHAEICSQLKITDSALRNRLFRARQHLRNECPDLLDL